MTRSRYVAGGVGVAVIRAGSIGTLRAQIAHRHPAVRFLRVSDVLEERASALAASCEADVWSTDPTALINRDEVNCVIVASTEDSHSEPAMAAIEAGKHLLVEKPLTILPDDGEKLIAAAVGSYMPGDWALGEHSGAMQEEPHAFINSVGQRRRDPILATGRDGLDVLVVSRAVDTSANTGEVVPITWGI
jgi:predicted dehydrogenase